MDACGFALTRSIVERPVSHQQSVMIDSALAGSGLRVCVCGYARVCVRMSVCVWYTFRQMASDVSSVNFMWVPTMFARDVRLLLQSDTIQCLSV